MQHESRRKQSGLARAPAFDRLRRSRTADHDLGNREVAILAVGRRPRKEIVIIIVDHHLDVTLALSDTTVRVNSGNNG